MEFTYYNTMPAEVHEIRDEVFVKEQGFQVEFDDRDTRCCHGLLTDKGKALGTCRFFPDDNDSEIFILGRICVRKDARGSGVGSELVREAEKVIKERGGKEIRLHAQVRAQHFYDLLGYQAYGLIEDEESVPHQWMKKEL